MALTNDIAPRDSRQILQSETIQQTTNGKPPPKAAAREELFFKRRKHSAQCP